MTTFMSGLVQAFTYQQNFLSDPYFYETLSHCKVSPAGLEDYF